MVDFEAFELPTLAVACPVCGRAAGAWCAGANAINICDSRGKAADAVFVAQYGPKAWIENLSPETQEPKRCGAGIWKVRDSAPAVAA